VSPKQTLSPTHVSESSNSRKNLVGVEQSRNPGVTSLLDLEDENGESDYLESSESSNKILIRKICVSLSCMKMMNQ
jgi:hypothetical protein